MISIGESVSLSIGTPKTPDLEAFVSTEPRAIERRIQHWLDNNDAVSALTTGIIIMDIEHPHPRDLHLYEKLPGRMGDRVIHAYATRA